MAYTKDTRRKPLKKKTLLMLPLKLQVSSFETQRSGGLQKKPGRNLQQISSNSWGWSWGVEKHLGNISSKSSRLCVCAWMYLLEDFGAEDMRLFCPAKTPINTILFSSQCTAWKNRLYFDRLNSEVGLSFKPLKSLVLTIWYIRTVDACQNCCSFWTR